MELCGAEDTCFESFPVNENKNGEIDESNGKCRPLPDAYVGANFITEIASAFRLVAFAASAAMEHATFLGPSARINSRLMGCAAAKMPEPC